MQKLLCKIQRPAKTLQGYWRWRAPRFLPAGPRALNCESADAIVDSWLLGKGLALPSPVPQKMRTLTLKEETSCKTDETASVKVVATDSPELSEIPCLSQDTVSCPSATEGFQPLMLMLIQHSKPRVNLVQLNEPRKQEQLKKRQLINNLAAEKARFNSTSRKARLEIQDLNSTRTL